MDLLNVFIVTLTVILLFADVQDAWSGQTVHVLLSKIEKYRLFYWDIHHVGPNMELESEVQ